MNNKLFFDFISVVEKVLHLIILGMVIFLCFEEVMSAVNGGGVRVESVLMLFIYLEIMQMVNIFFSTGKIPIRYPLYIGMFALARHISFEDIKGIVVNRSNMRYNGTLRRSVELVQFLCFRSSCWCRCCGSGRCGS